MPSRTSKYRIAYITCYFGEAPWYLSFFLKSCAFNPTIDFFIVGDLPLPQFTLPANVFPVFMTLEQVSALAAEKLSLPVNISEPYKLCDLKPAYGIIFGDLLASYDFWAHGDIDVIFGDIRGFITSRLLKNYDVICVQEAYVTGFFSLFRNTPNINLLYQLSPDYKTVFTSPGHFCFDECNFAWIPLMEGFSIFDIRTPIQSMTHVVKSQHAKGNIRALFQMMVIEGLCGQMQWDHGRLYFADKVEALLYHLIKFKKQESLKIPRWDTVPDNYYIEKDHFLAHAPRIAGAQLQ